MSKKGIKELKRLLKIVKNMSIEEYEKLYKMVKKMRSININMRGLDRKR